MRVCFITTTYPQFSGDYSGIFIHRLAKSLATSGVEVTVVAPGGKQLLSSEQIDGITIQRFSYWIPRSYQKLAYGHGIPENIRNHHLALLQIPSFILAGTIKMLQVCSSKQDLIHAHFSPSALMGLWGSRVFGIPLVLTVRGSDVRSLPVTLNRLACNQADALISISPEIGALLSSIGVPDDKINFVPNVMDDDRFNPSNIVGGQIRNEFNLGQSPLVTFVGRLNTFKDPETFVRAIPLVLHKKANTKFIIVGGGPLMRKISDLSQKLGIENNLIITGTRQDIPEILKDTTVFIAISPVENIWSNTLVEAMFMNVPIIATKAGYTHLTLTHQENAFLVPPRNALVLAEGIVDLLDNADLRKKLVANARNTLTEHHFGAKQTVERTLQIYHDLQLRKNL